MPKVPSLQVPPGAAGDLAELRRIELAEAEAVELLVRGEGDVVDIEVEPHADGVGGDEVVDVPGLVELDLGVAGARRERAEDHGGAAALAADQFGDGVDLLRREGDDGGAVRQAGDLLLAGEGELREPRPGDDVDARDQRLDQGAHGARADQQRLLAAALVEEAVGEDVAAVEIGGELDLVDGDEGDVEVARHRLDGGDPVARPVRLDLLLAGDQGDVVGAGPLDDAAVDLAREKPSGSPIMPVSCPSMRSMARWVLPVLVGPSTAVTLRARSDGGRERREKFNDRRPEGRVRGRSSLGKAGRELDRNCANRTRTNRGRKRSRSRPGIGPIWRLPGRRARAGPAYCAAPALTAGTIRASGWRAKLEASITDMPIIVRMEMRRGMRTRVP